MRFLILLYIFSLQAVFAGDPLFSKTHIRANRGKFTYPQDATDKAFVLINHELNKQKTLVEQINRVKYAMINGNLATAKVLLLKMKIDKNFTKAIQYRYLAMINFIEGNYQKSLNNLTRKELKPIRMEKRICYLKILNYIALDKKNELANSWDECSSLVSDHASGSNQVWLNTLSFLRLSKDSNPTEIPFRGIAIENEKIDSLRTFLKLALYLNQPKKVLSSIAKLDEDVFDNQVFRELIALLYYKNGQFKKAYDFIEDLSTPNAEILKGNLYLAQEKHELAYAQFKLALKLKDNSHNALERALPLAWKLNQFNDGVNFVQRLQVNSKHRFQKLLMSALMYTQLEKYQKAEEQLKEILIYSNLGQQDNVDQLYSYLSLMQKDKKNAEVFSNQSCKGHDGVSCWVLYQLENWENFPLTILREDKVFSKDNNLLDELVAKKINDPIKENIFIHQKEIEELDNSLISIR